MFVPKISNKKKKISPRKIQKLLSEYGDHLLKMKKVLGFVILKVVWLTNGHITGSKKYNYYNYI